MNNHSKGTQTEFYLLEENDIHSIITDVKVINDDEKNSDEDCIGLCCLILWYIVIILSFVLYFKMTH